MYSLIELVLHLAMEMSHHKSVIVAVRLQEARVRIGYNRTSADGQDSDRGRGRGRGRGQQMQRRDDRGTKLPNHKATSRCERLSIVRVRR